ncbi:MAG: hypothetical protein Q4C61_14815 [Lachnospiraceae bacterium]|nr:hypothetical protein [Lachnospiraceae bacterium]
MKKLLYIIVLSLLLLSGCEKKTAETAPASLFEMTGDTTAAGIKPGDGREDFIKAYKDYTIQVAYSDLESNYLVMSINDIPYKDPIFTMIANFFINGEPVSETELCEKNSVTPSNLHSLLSSASYLREHEVIYRYLLFRWRDGVITGIESDELNYNETFETPYAKA